MILPLVLVVLRAAPARADEPPVPGLADLHLHQWAEYNYGGDFYHGHADGPADIALEGCGLAGPNGAKGQLEPEVKHAQFGGQGVRSGARRKTELFLKTNVNDDTRTHPPEGLTEDARYPSFLGWPTSDSVAHQQAWTGWLRLAHEESAFAWFLVRGAQSSPRVEDGEILLADTWSALGEFYADYRGNMGRAAAAGAAGLNLVVVSLVASNTGCRAIVSHERRTQDPSVCDEPAILLDEYRAAVDWGRRNADWAAIVTTPADARRVIAEGRLAVVLSLESSDVLRDYAARLPGMVAFDNDPATDPDRPETWPDEAVRDAIRWALEQMPLVSTFSPVHQLDNPFGGGAVVDPTLFRAGAVRFANAPSYYGGETLRLLRHPDRVNLCPKGATDAECAELRRRNASIFASAWEDTTFDGAWRDPDVVGTFLRFITQAEADHIRYASLSSRSPRDVVGGIPAIVHNHLGLTHHGELLLEVMTERGLPVDLSHASDELVAGIRAWVEARERAHAPAPAVFLSHAYPRAIDAIPNELHVADATLAWVGERHGVVGVRPGDDFVRTSGAAALTPALARLLDTTTCQGTSVATLAFAAWIRERARGAGMAWGTDLNGFINQPGPTGAPREPMSLLPCASVVPSIGSEVGTRGLAHIGLLTSFFGEERAFFGAFATGSVEGVVAPDSRESALLSEAIGDIGQGADAFVRMWERGPQAPSHPPTAPGPLPRVGRPILDAGAWQWGVRLPINRAIEAVLPYASTTERGSPALVAPQLPTNMGLLIGWKTWGMQRPRGLWAPELKRCQRAWGAAACDTLHDAKAGAETGRSSSSSRTWGPEWHREFLGSWRVFGDYLTRLGEAPSWSAARISANVEAVADVTRRWLAGSWPGSSESRLSCLDDYTFTEAPVPGVPVGDDVWLRCRLGDPDMQGACARSDLVRAAWSVADGALPDGGGRGVSCYCGMLSAVTGDPQAHSLLTERDRYVLALCVESRATRGKWGGYPGLVRAPPAVDPSTHVPVELAP